ncbi:hemerythrin domain-containing protein [Allosphingosinicella indica]|uniref:Hemerythrin HHE cation binding domain-containing protein n=1 Tax=Allosphingosinicella indica TaxID=941907 RepID=A0A1X7FYR6_9SPHN|nr:hemerythrin domain-containing protein [Allosphingosinicella indica]SMF61232.1 Hemerythrin HHE cation binding domain-containing protein [Allosphingosinicella indica]
MATTTRSRSNSARVSDNKTSFLLGALAAGAAAGIAAVVARKGAAQAPSYFAGEWDEALKAEHDAVRAIFDALEESGDDAKIKRTALLAKLKYALTKHAIEEENVIYPALRESGRSEEADELNREHGYVKQFLFELSNTPANSPKFLETVRRFRADIEDHMREEEEKLFPQLRAQLGNERNRELTRTINLEGFKVA